MKKSFVAIVTSIILFLFSSAIAEQEDLYTYQVNDDNTVTITGFDWNNNHGDIYIPEMLSNRIVSTIGEKAFSTEENKAVKITLPDNIRSIGAEAFRGASITYINIPLNTVEIGDGAFAECSIMRFNVAEGHSVFATIDNSLYNKQTKTLIAWPLNKEVDQIPYGIKKIGPYAFYGRDSIEVRLPRSVEMIGKYAFSNARDVSLWASGVSVIDDYAFYNGSVTINTPLALSRIGKYAFAESYLYFEEGSQNEKNLLSSTPYEIDEYAFYDCYGKATLVLENATSIGAHAFERDMSTIMLRDYKCDFDIIIEADDLKDLTYLGENAFLWGNIVQWGNKSSGFYAYAYLVNDSLKSIPDDAFAYTAITDLKTNSTVTEIGKGAFHNSDLNHVELSDGLQKIGDKAFEECEDLKSIIIPASVTEIGKGAFRNSSLESVLLSDGLQTIKDEAFKDCKGLTSISIPASVIMMGNDIFNGCPDSFVVTVEAGSYGEVWARTCGYSYQINGKTDDTSWLSDDAESNSDKQPELSPGFEVKGSIVEFGEYEQDGNLSNGKEKIEWIVLDVQEGKSLLLSKYGLDVGDYYSDSDMRSQNKSWETCYLREWLNSTFINSAFTIEEQSYILESLVDNSSKQFPFWKYKSSCDDTIDRIFLLSILEAKKYFEFEEDRLLQATPYALSKNPEGINGCYYWWLRYGKAGDVVQVDVDSEGGISGGAGENYCIRPAMWFTWY